MLQYYHYLLPPYPEDITLILYQFLSVALYHFTSVANRILVSPGGVRSIWLRNDLNNISKRLKALEAKMAQDGIILTESQLQVLEKRRNEKEAHGEIDTQHPGYLGCQDTYYVGNLKGIGKVYSQVFIDSYSRVADAKVYTDKTAITAADMLNDRVLPWYESQGIPILRILTDRGSEYKEI